MRLALRFVVPLVIVLSLIAYAAIPLFESLDRYWAMRDLDYRAKAIANASTDAVSELVKAHDDVRIKKFFERAILDERLYALGFCTPKGVLRYRTSNLPADVKCGRSGDVRTEGYLHISQVPIRDEDFNAGDLIVVHDMSYIGRRSVDTKRYLFWLFIAMGLTTSVVTVFVAQFSNRSLIGRVRKILKMGLQGRLLQHLHAAELKPIAQDLRAFLKDVKDERNTRDELQMSWTPKTLKSILKDELAGDEVLIVSNREPYIANFKGDQIVWSFPASGLVTALEPVMRACSGTWIAHGSGSADKATVDGHDRVRVPPDKPSYQIRRIWLDKDEEQGYYYGFSNEGLWPLCHMAYARPVFRLADWEQYKKVNEKFAQTVCQEAHTEDPVILVQDYHLALLPQMIRKRLPKATIITFWHIPWPNPEAFGICPWRKEILEGLLGSSILGFHTRYFCNNFIDTVDRMLEARIDRETSQISFGGKVTAIKSYPISIEWPSKYSEAERPIAEVRAELRERNNIGKDVLLGIGVDRLDYTKGINERFLAVEKLLERKPEWIGKFTLIQIAAPSRSSLEQYQNLDHQVRETADRINQRFGGDGYLPICLKIEHHTPQQVFEYYRASEVCMVTSLHDGMNLVAKEFIAARDDERGVLILSQFTGAARELPEALIINPYDIHQCAAALHVALSMPADEQRARMRSMRGLVQENNVYRWAGRMLMDAARIRAHDRVQDRIQDNESWA
jgi:trehalose 6-phosphate synthase